MFGFSASSFKRERSSDRRICPGDLLPEAQSLLSALADVEYRYETAHAFMDQWPGPADVKQSCLDTLSESRKHERGLLVRQLAELEQRLIPIPERASVPRTAPGRSAALVLECA
jgi:hypothetical protein